MDAGAWLQPPETAIAAMRPIAETITRQNEAVKSDWQVDADREAAVNKLVEEIDQNQRELRIVTLAIALARSLTETRRKPYSTSRTTNRTETYETASLQQVPKARTRAASPGR